MNESKPQAWGVPAVAYSFFIYKSVLRLLSKQSHGLQAYNSNITLNILNV